MTEKNRSPPLSGGTSTEAIEPTILFRKDRYIYMELKFVIPNMEKTFGNLEFAGEENRTEKNQRTHGGTLP